MCFLRLCIKRCFLEIQGGGLLEGDRTVSVTKVVEESDNNCPDIFGRLLR